MSCLAQKFLSAVETATAIYYFVVYDSTVNTWRQFHTHPFYVSSFEHDWSDYLTLLCSKLNSKATAQYFILPRYYIKKIHDRLNTVMVSFFIFVIIITNCWRTIPLSRHRAAWDSCIVHFLYRPKEEDASVRISFMNYKRNPYTSLLKKMRDNQLDRGKNTLMTSSLETRLSSLTMPSSAKNSEYVYLCYIR